MGPNWPKNSFCANTYSYTILQLNRQTCHYTFNADVQWQANCVDQVLLQNSQFLKVSSLLSREFNPSLSLTLFLLLSVCCIFRKIVCFQWLDGKEFCFVISLAAIWTAAGIRLHQLLPAKTAKGEAAGTELNGALCCIQGLNAQRAELLARSGRHLYTHGNQPTKLNVKRLVQNSEICSEPRTENYKRAKFVRSFDGRPNGLSKWISSMVCLSCLPIHQVFS